ncbi:hypothetical protein Trydic_g6327 [Trypoxylus dichotomus]
MNRGHPTRIREIEEEEDVREADAAAKRARDGEDPEVTVPCSNKQIKEEAWTEAREKWQREWEQEERGRGVYAVMKTVGTGKKGWTSKAVQLMTGHGYFKAYYRRFGLREGNGECECGGGLETAEHVWWECQKEERKAARERFVARTGADPRLRDWDGRLEEAELLRAVNELAEELVVDDEQWQQRR